MNAAEQAFCSEAGCSNHVQKEGHTLCYAHWKKSKQTAEEPAASYVAIPKPVSSDANGGVLNSTSLGEKFNLSAKQMNRVLLDLGWIEKDGTGWRPSGLGEKLQAKRLIHSRSGTPFVQWHQDICKSRILQNAVNELLSIELEPLSVAQPPQIAEEAADKPEGFREKFPPTIRASDGHMVRSRGEAMIDALFYENRIVHAYERLVPVEQAMYCDFYLPEYDLYIEFWGMESNPKYRARKTKKLEIYRQNGLRLLEVKDEHINNLDDYLISQLVKFGYKPK
ncbi:hypothetical protein GALL_34940 [mine drainage metagenome]|uniref:Uncharacterized protein n=1 Tax=mine drainage metagenome TaxID=410659 RepID=A0A1J5TV63_9ZZZZ